MQVSGHSTSINHCLGFLKGRSMGCFSFTIKINNKCFLYYSSLQYFIYPRKIRQTDWMKNRQKGKGSKQYFKKDHDKNSNLTFLSCHLQTLTIMWNFYNYDNKWTGQLLTVASGFSEMTSRVRLCLCLTFWGNSRLVLPSWLFLSLNLHMQFPFAYLDLLPGELLIASKQNSPT